MTTKIKVEDALQNYFANEFGYVVYPAECKECGWVVNTLSGVSIHLRKKHGIYIDRTTSRRVRKIKKLINTK